MNLTTDVEVFSVSGTHIPGESNHIVKLIQFVNGTMFSLPNGVGIFFENVERILVGNNRPWLMKIKFIKRSSFVSLTKLTYIGITSNDLEKIDSDAFVDLPNLETFYLYGNGSLVLHENTFEQNEKLSTIEIMDVHLKHIPGNLFRNNLLLEDIRLFVGDSR